MLILIAETLLEKETLTREEIKSLVENGKLPGETKKKKQGPKEDSEKESKKEEN